MNAIEKQMAEAIRLALSFELLWCRWRRQTYLALAREDAERMRKIEEMLSRTTRVSSRP